MVVAMNLMLIRTLLATAFALVSVPAIAQWEFISLGRLPPA